MLYANIFNMNNISVTSITPEEHRDDLMSIATDVTGREHLPPPPPETLGKIRTAYADALKRYPNNEEYCQATMNRITDPILALSRNLDLASKQLYIERGKGLETIPDILEIKDETTRRMILRGIGLVWYNGINIVNVPTHPALPRDYHEFGNILWDSFIPDKQSAGSYGDMELDGIRMTYGRYSGATRVTIYPNPLQQIGLIGEVHAPIELLTINRNNQKIYTSTMGKQEPNPDITDLHNVEDIDRIVENFLKKLGNEATEISA